MSTRRDFLGAAVIGLTAAWQSRVFAADGPTRGPIKIGQIGTSHGHATKLSVYRSSPDYEVVGLVEPNRDLRAIAEQQPAFRDVPWMTQEQLLNTPGLQAVLVEVRPRDSLSVAEACLAAGKHVHLDKPAGESLPHFRRILEAATNRRLLVQMGYMFRYNPAIKLLREFVSRGWLGDLFEVHTVMSKVVGAADRRQLAEYPGGMMFELGCHVIDLVVGLLGKPQNVVAFPQHSSRTYDDGLADNMLAVLAYERATASIRASALEIDGGARRHLVVCGTEGTFHIQPLESPQVRVALRQPQGEWKPGYQDVTFAKYTRYIDDAADMARIVRGEKESDFSPAHDLAVQETVLRACRLEIT